MPRIRNSSTRALHRAVAIAAAASASHAYLLVHGGTHFIAAGDAVAGAAWCTRPSTILARLSVTPIEASRWWLQSVVLARFTAHVDVACLRDVLRGSIVWLEETGADTLAVFVQAASEVAPLAPLTRAIRAAAAPRSNRLFTWSHQPPWVLHRVEPMEVVLQGCFSARDWEAALASSNGKRGCWRVLGETYLAYDVSGHVTWTGDIMIGRPVNLPDRSEPLQTAAQRHTEPLSEEVSWAEGGPWGTVRVGRVSVELGFGQLSAVAGSNRWLICQCGQTFFVLFAPAGWRAASSHALSLRNFQGRLLPSNSGPEGEIEALVVISESVVFSARNTGVWGHKSTLSSQFWIVTDEGVMPVGEPEDHHYEHPVGGFEVQAEATAHGTMVTVTFFDEYYRPHQHRSELPIRLPIVGIHKAEDATFRGQIHLAFLPNAVFEDECPVQNGWVVGAAAPPGTRSLDELIETQRRTLTADFGGPAPEALYDLATSTWKCAGGYDLAALVGRRLFVLFPGDFAVVELRIGQMLSSEATEA